MVPIVPVSQRRLATRLAVGLLLASLLLTAAAQPLSLPAPKAPAPLAGVLPVERIEPGAPRYDAFLRSAADLMPAVLAHPTLDGLATETAGMGQLPPHRGFLVVLPEPPVAALEGVSAQDLLDHRARLLAAQDAHLEAIRALVPGADASLRFTTVLNGFALDVPDEAAQLLRAKGYAVWPNVAVQAQLADSVPLIRADEVWGPSDPVLGPSAAGVTGVGMRIAIVDTGIDYGHGDLSACRGLGPCSEALGLVCSSPAPCSVGEPVPSLVPEEPMCGTLGPACEAAAAPLLAALTEECGASCTLAGVRATLCGGLTSEPTLVCALIAALPEDPAAAATEAGCGAALGACDLRPDSLLACTDARACDMSAHDIVDGACDDACTLKPAKQAACGATPVLCLLLAALPDDPAGPAVVVACGAVASDPCDTRIRDAVACTGLGPVCAMTVREVLEFLADCGVGCPVPAVKVAACQAAPVLCVLAAALPDDPVGDAATLACAALGAMDLCESTLEDAWGTLRAAACASLFGLCSPVPALLPCSTPPCAPAPIGCLGLGCKVAGGFDVVHWDADPYDDHGHGTHVAAIAAGNGHFKGVAPDATLYAYKVLDANGMGYAAWIIGGIELAVDPDQDPTTDDGAHVINLSLGGLGDPDDPMAQAVEGAVAAGAVVTVSAGNAGCFNGPYGNAFVRVCSPGAAAGALTVAASDKSDVRADFSSRGPVIWDGKALAKPDTTAPGVDICAARARVIRDLAPWYPTCGPDHIALSGTSMAAPHAAGLAALVLQAHPAWSPEQVKAAIAASGVPVGGAQRGTGMGGTLDDVGSRAFSLGGGRLDAYVAVVQEGEPPLARLDPMGMDGWPTQVHGTVQGAPLASWSLAYSRFEQAAASPTWTVLHTATTAPASSLLFDLTSRLKHIPDGPTVLRLQATDAAGRTATDHGLLWLDKMQLVEPRMDDVVGGLVPVRVAALSTMTPGTPTLQYGKVSGYHDDPAAWLPATLTTGPDPKWDTRGLASGYYRLRASLPYAGTTLVDREEAWVVVDSTTQPGWPVHVPHEKVPIGTSCGNCPPGSSFTPWDMRHVTADLQGDGRAETLVVVFGEPPRLRAYGGDGTLLWSAPLGNTFGWDPAPVVGDLENDGQLEVFAPAITRPSTGPLPRPETGWLHAYRADGTPVPGWPRSVGTVGHGLFLAAGDLDGTGGDEVVAVTYKDGPKVAVADAAGLRHQWHVPVSTTAYPMGYKPPALANFDADAGLELMFPSTSAGTSDRAFVHVHDPDGTVVPGWPVSINGYFWESPTAQDIDGDGKAEVLATRHATLGSPPSDWGGVFVFEHDGTLRPGFPVAPVNIYQTQPVAADLAAAPGLELVVQGWDLEVRTGTGAMVAGWPRHPCVANFGVPFDTGVAFANVDGVPGLEVLDTAGSWDCILRGIDAGGIRAYRADGTSVAGFPKQTGSYNWAPAQVVDLDGDGTAEVVANSWYDSAYSDLMLRPAFGKDRASLHGWSP